MSIPVKGAAAAERATLRYSVQGPVVSHDPARHRATALAAIDHAAGRQRRLRDDRDQPGAGLGEPAPGAFRFHPSPTNFHYADVDGNHRLAGDRLRAGAQARRRPDAGAGRRPLRLDRACATSARCPASTTRPRAGSPRPTRTICPPAGRATASRLSRSSEPYRYERIADVLSRSRDHSARRQRRAAARHIVHAGAAADRVAARARLPTRAQPAVAMLRGWDARLDADSAAAALFEILWRELGTRHARRDRPRAGASAGRRRSRPSVLLGLLAHPDARLGADPAAARDALLDAALAAAWANARASSGPDPAAWRWGTLHQVAHPRIRCRASRRSPPPFRRSRARARAATTTR